MIVTAEEQARSVADALASHIAADRNMVVIEPSNLAMFCDEYRRFLDEETARPVRERSYERLECVYGLLDNGAKSDTLTLADDGETVAYHSHCQQQTLGLEAHTVAVLDELGYTATTSNAECCGMAESFGYKREYCELSVDIGEDLCASLEASETDYILTIGTSYTEQVNSIGAIDPAYPIELIAPNR